MTKNLHYVSYARSEANSDPSLLNYMIFSFNESKTISPYMKLKELFNLNRFLNQTLIIKTADGLTLTTSFLDSKDKLQDQLSP